MAARVYFPEGKNQIKASLKKMDANNPVTLAKVTSFMTSQASMLEQYMKSHHPWTNRTGNAERGLNARVTQSKKKFVTTITLAHGKDVWYGVYLEYSMGQRYAIIEPTIRLKGPEITSQLGTLLDSLMSGG